ncbi:MAG: WGxxGxxG-CTERM domain-containing protein [Microcoleus sp. SIO2G3]|nr:WGxxGxxG-CTERM domain-containing protein [Microcoleus sp. SIO2G3]
MQRSDSSKSLLSKVVGASILAASVAFVPFNLPVNAQTNTAPDTTTTTDQGVQTAEYDDEDSFDWGWLGLLGLAGLAGLAGRKRHDDNDVRYRETRDAHTTHYGQ